MAEIAIVGAGLAGVTLAKNLSVFGHHCSLFEKSHGRGGRLATRVYDDWQVDHGTQYFTARTERFREEVAHWLHSGWAAVWDFTPSTFSVQELVLSADEQTRYVGTPKMNTMIHGILNDINHVELYFETRVDRLEQQQNRWRLWDDQGEHYGMFDAVLLTAPLAQTLALLPSGAMAEAPMRAAIMYPTWAFGLCFQQPTGISATGIFANDSVISWAAKDSTKPGRIAQYETWMLHFTPSWSSNHLEAQDELLEAQAVSFLRKLGPNTLPPIHKSMAHRWLYARSGSKDVSIPHWDDRLNIGLAGDWTMGSRLEDAWLSATHLASRVQQSLSG